MNEEIEKWAEKVINEITPFAEKHKRTFYPLQLAIKINPDLLIIGINPGGGHTYREQQKPNSKWAFVNNKMTVKTLLAGNPHIDSWESWTCYKKLKK